MYRNSKGQSMIQVLMAMGLVAILLTLMASIFSGQNKEARAIEERLSALEIERTLVATLQTGGVLTYQLKLAGVPLLDSTTFPKTLNGANTGGVLDYILASGNPGAPSIVKVGVAPLLSTPQLVVKTISLTINPGTSDQYPSSLVVTFDDTKLVRPVKPASVQMTVQTDPATGATVKKIVSVDNPLCPAGFYTMANGACVACAPGTAQSMAGQTSCNTCTASNYSNNGSGQSGSTACIPCGSQQWSANGADTCAVCSNLPLHGQASGTVYAGPGTSATCPIGTLSCNPGYENGGTTTACSACNAGKYSGGGVGACSTCGVDHYSLAAAIACTICGPTQYAPAGSPSAASCVGCSDVPTNGASASYSGQGGGANQCPYATVTCNSGYVWNSVTSYAGATCTCTATNGNWTVWACPGTAGTRSCTNPTPSCGGADCSAIDGGSPTGTCTAYYPDADGDGHGDAGASPIYTPPGGSPPIGYVTNNDDCCDTDNRAFAGQTAYYSTPIAGACAKAGTYDFNCNGTDERGSGFAERGTLSSGGADFQGDFGGACGTAFSTGGGGDVWTISRQPWTIPCGTSYAPCDTWSASPAMPASATAWNSRIWSGSCYSGSGYCSTAQNPYNSHPLLHLAAPGNVSMGCH